MPENRSMPVRHSRRKILVTGILALALFFALAFWGGAPTREKLPAFFLGVALLAIVTSAFAFAAWHLLLRPLPPGHKDPELNMMKASSRRLLAALVAISGISLVVGGFWDEVWHRQYGIPFGEDLFWRPHLLIYSSILVTCLLAGWGLLDMLRHGKGTLQQRFRANPIVGLMVLVGAFMMFALPADPLWHILYGEDISAWSLPHIILMFSFALVMILAAAIHLSTVAQRTWRTIRHFDQQDILVIVVLAFTLMVGLQALTTDWDSERLALLQQRPEWLLPAVIVAMATLIGTFANHALRMVGAATVTGLLALVIRFGLLQVFDYPGISLGAWLMALAPMIAMDLWYGYSLNARQNPPKPAIAGVTAMTGMALISYPLLNRFYAYPQIGLGNLVPVMLTGLIAAGGAAWVGQGLGDYLAMANKQVEPTTFALRSLRLAPAIALVAVVTFIFVFISTASPPF